MELLIIIALLITLDLVAIRWGADSRPGIDATHHRAL